MADTATTQPAPPFDPAAPFELPVLDPRGAGSVDIEALLSETLQADPPVMESAPRDLSYDAVLSPFVIVFCAAFAFAWVFTPIMRNVAIAYGVIDQPDGGRKLHTRPVAYLGGVAIFVGLIAGLTFGSAFSEVPALRGLVQIPIPIVAGATIITLLGLLDDLVGVRPKLKILGQVAAAIALLAFGIGSDVLREPTAFVFEWLHVNLSIAVPEQVEVGVIVAASSFFVVGLVVFCCNASNLMDGLDGLCGGVTAIIAAGLVFVAANLAIGGPIDRANDDAVRLALSLALFGAVLGFLPFNFNPASIFMGDAGSLLMGFVIATMILLIGDVGSKWMLGGLVMFSLPVLDTALAFARRWTAGRPLFSADKHHFHHQLIARGLTVRRAVVLSYGLTIFFVAAGAMLVYFRTRYAVAFYMVLFGSIIVAAYKIGMIHERVSPDRTDDEPATPPAVPARPEGEAPPVRQEVAV